MGTEFIPELTSVGKNDLLKKNQENSLRNVSEQSLNLCIRPTFNDPFVVKKGIENEEKG